MGWVLVLNIQMHMSSDYTENKVSIIMGWIFVACSPNAYAEFLSFSGMVSVGGAYGK